MLFRRIALKKLKKIVVQNDEKIIKNSISS